MIVVFAAATTHRRPNKYKKAFLISETALAQLNGFINRKDL
jgi:hypothetical protein